MEIRSKFHPYGFIEFPRTSLLAGIPVITSQLHGSEAEGPKRMPIRVCLGPSASLPCSCDVITGKVYFRLISGVSHIMHCAHDGNCCHIKKRHINEYIIIY